MKLNELITTEQGIASILKSFFAPLYEKFFNDTEPTNIDNFILYKYGNFECYSKFVNYTELANFLLGFILLNKEKWLKNFEFFEKKFKFANVSRETKTGTIETENFNNSQTLNAEKAFNENSFNDNTQIQNTENTNGTQTYNLIVTRETDNTDLNINTLFTNVQMNLITDIINSITLNIF